MILLQRLSAIVQAGLPSTVYQQMDDTGARVNGKNHYTHVLCNPYYTAYFTRPNKNRLTILRILSKEELSFVFNESTYALMKQVRLSGKTLAKLKRRKPANVMNRQEVDVLLNKLFPDPLRHTISKSIILEAAAIVAYQKLPNAIRILLTDDAPQFKQITKLLALCWIHDGRQYKKLTPIVPFHIKQLEEFLTAYWDYYHRLLDYKSSPTPLATKQLTKDFDTLFATQT